MSEEILFGSAAEMSAREQAVWGVMEKTRDMIIRKCNKCTDGFIDITPNPNIQNLESFAAHIAKECECRGRAEWVSKLIYSGIPKQFVSADAIKLPIDKNSLTVVLEYIAKLDKAYGQGLGLLFCKSGPLPLPNGNLARQMAAIKVLLTALSKKYSVHFIDINDYIELFRKAARDDTKTDLIHEINSVDFLCIDNIGNISMTDYMGSQFESVISCRVLNKVPTIFLSHRDWKYLETWFGPLCDSVMQNCVKISITEFKKAKQNFATIEGKL